MIHDIKIEMRVRLVTKSRPHDTPADGALVGPVNNVLASMIESVKLTINDQKSKCPKVMLLGECLKCVFASLCSK